MKLVYIFIIILSTLNFGYDRAMPHGHRKIWINCSFGSFKLKWRIIDIIIEIPGLSAYRQEYLCKSLAGIDYDAHGASSEVRSLQSLINSLNIGLEHVNIRSTSPKTVIAVDFYSYSHVVHPNLPSLQPLIIQKIISCLMATKWHVHVVDNSWNILNLLTIETRLRE